MTEPASRFEVIPSGGPCGAELRGLDVSTAPSPETVNRLKRELALHGVLLLRDAKLDQTAQIALTNSFGPSIRYPAKQLLGHQPEAEGREFVTHIAHHPDAPEKDGQLGFGAVSWHSDLQFTPTPWLYTFLYAIEATEEGGETEFSNLVEAYRTLDWRTRMHFAFADGEHTLRDSGESERHRLVQRHPVSGRKCLYISPVYTRRLHGVNRRRRRQIHQELIRHISDERFVWSHRWRTGDLLIWDNLCTMHRRLQFAAHLPRQMRRSQPSITLDGNPSC